MTANFNSQNSNHQPISGNQNQSGCSPDVLQRDRFEMLSAYLDGEVSANERRQVEDWLANDPSIQCLYSRLLKLRQAFQTMPVPTADSRTVQTTVDAVLARVDRRPPLSVIWGGIAIAAVAIGAITGTLIRENPFNPQIAQTPSHSNSDKPVAQEEPLYIALDKPLVSLPASSNETLNQTAPIPKVPTDIR